MKADFYMGDLYPNLAYFSTRAETIPEAADQTSLVDNPDQAAANPLDVAPDTSRNIMFSVGAIFLVVVLLGMRF